MYVSSKLIENEQVVWALVTRSFL